MSKERLALKRGYVYFDGERIDCGAAVIGYGAIFWMGYAVGPWWVALAIFLIAIAANAFIVWLFLLARNLEKRKAYGKIRHD